VFDEERRTKPLRMIFEVLVNPFTRPLSKRSNERQRSLWQNPDVSFTRGAVHCLPSVFASGGSGLIGNSGRKTAKVCDKHAKETTRNIAIHFTVICFHHSSPGIAEQSSKRCSQRRSVSRERRSLPLSSLAVIHDGLRCGLAQLRLCAHFLQRFLPVFQLRLH
jgi:hypothetical protein